MQQVITPSQKDLDAWFLDRYGDPATCTGSSPTRRHRFGYYFPANIYEIVVDKLVQPGCRWLDVGGGKELLPENPKLSRRLVERSSQVVAVDPSENVLKNEWVHEKVHSFLEDYHTEVPFDLATMRMVVEHVENPGAFLNSLAALVKPGGHAVVFTVNLWSPITFASQMIPFQYHHGIKKKFWGGEEEDTFPVQYRMNTRFDLKRLFHRAGFDEAAFLQLDDLSAFGQFRRLNFLELSLWKMLTRLRIPYPENCLLGLYKRR